MPSKLFYLPHAKLMRFVACFRLTAIALLAAATLASSPARAQIQPAADGTGTQVNLNGNQFDISGGTLASDGANLFHSFAQFGLSLGQIANFLSDPQVRNILSRVTGGDPSVIHGLLQVTGSDANLYLMNPAGLVFGPDASLNISSDFWATTATGIGFAGDRWFDAFGNSDLANLTGNPSQFAFDLAQAGSIVNAGNLAVNSGQRLTLLGGTVANTGQLTAPAGQITVAAIPGTSRVRISQPGQLLSLEIELPRDASGQPLPVSPLDLPQLLVGAGVATGLTAHSDGTVSVAGSDLSVPLAVGTSLISGGLDVAAAAATGGAIAVLGDRLALIDANLNASGSSGGNIRLGGDYLGQGNIPNAQQLFVNGNTQIAANAGNAGDGGRIILWSDDTTAFAGQIAARGGTQTGDGGFVEVSGRQDLLFRGEVDVSAPNGAAGSLLLDPQNITIVNGGGGANDAGLPAIFSGAAPGANFTISETALEGLANTANVILQATNDIIINDLADDELAFAAVGGGTDGSIAFQAGNNFTVLDTNDIITAPHRNFSISAGGAIATGEINLSGGAGLGGDLTLTAGGSISTGQILTSLLNDVTSVGGDVTLTAGGNITVRDQIKTSSPGTGGNVVLRTTNPGGNITFQSINTALNSPPATPGQATTGGNVTIAARGTARGQTIAPGTTATIYTTGAVTSGTISITHDGGPNNLPFVAGGATANGTAGAIQGANTLATGNFPVLPNGGAATGTPAGIAIASINSPPTVSPLPAVSVAPGQTLSFSFADLAAQVSDPDLDNLTLTANPLATGGRFSLNGTPVSGPVTLSPGDVLTFTAESSLTGSVDLFSLSASDVVSGSNVETVRAGGLEPTASPAVSLGNCPPFCDEERAAANLEPLAEREDLLDWELLSHFCRDRPRSIASLERLYSREYSQFFDFAEPEVVRDRAAAQQVLQQAAAATGRSSGLVYLAFCPRELLPSVAADAQQQLKGQVGPVSGAKSDRPASELANPAPRDDDQLVLVLVPPEGEPLRYPVGATRAEVRAGALDFRRKVTNQRRSAAHYLPPAQQMHAWLLAPLQADLERLGIEHLIYVPDAGLRLIPLAAMHDGTEFAIARYSFSLVPSLTLTDSQPAKLDGLRVLAMGAEFFRDQPRLPAVPVEVKAIAEELWSGKAYLDADFTLANLQAARQTESYGIVHLATHSDFRPGEPRDSYIQLSDRRVRLDQLDKLALDLPSVELLVLSACRTALGDPSAELGFAGLAVASGVKSSLGSLWYVSDGGTLVLMTAFYEQLQNAPYRAAALREAQLALLRGEATLEPGQVSQRGRAIALPPNLRLGSPDLAHPYYWSAFALVGNPW